MTMKSASTAQNEENVGIFVLVSDIGHPWFLLCYLHYPQMDYMIMYQVPAMLILEL